MEDTDLTHELPVQLEEAPVENIYEPRQAAIIRPRIQTWEIELIAGMAIITLLTRFYHLSWRAVSYDEGLHTYFSWLLANGKQYIHNPMMHGPFLFESTAFLYKLFGGSDFTSRLAPVILGTLLVILIPHLLRPWLGRAGSYAASALFILSPYVSYYSRYLRHDLLLVTWAAFAVLFLFRYLEYRRNKDLYYFTGALALMFSTMEITFMYLAILAGFLVLRMIWFYRVDWRAALNSAELDLLVLLITLGGLFSAPIALPVLNRIWVQYTGAPFVDISLFNTQTFSTWETGATGQHLAILWAVFAAAAAFIGNWWNWKRWTVSAIIFLAITVPLFTTFFTNMSGLWTGFLGSLGYWLSQQGVARGAQPWYYYMVVYPLYEYLPLIGAVCAGIYALVKRRTLTVEEKTFVPFLAWWAVGIFAALSVAGEKMPWLSTHIAVPMILLAGWWGGRLFADRWSWGLEWRVRLRVLVRGMGLAAILLLAVFTARTAIMVNYIDYNYTTEYIDYAHGGPGFKWLEHDLALIENSTSAGKNLQIAYDNYIAWPTLWYLRVSDNQLFMGTQPSAQIANAGVVLAGPADWQATQQILGNHYTAFQVIRIWWPLEDYKKLTWQRIRFAITDPAMRSAVWQIIWNRNYQPYAKLSGYVLNPPSAWPLSELMNIYIRNDLISQIPGGISSLELAPYKTNTP